MSWDHLAASALNTTLYDVFHDADLFHYFLIHHGCDHVFFDRYPQHAENDTDVELVTSIQDCDEETVADKLSTASDRGFLLVLCTWPHLAEQLLTIAIKNERVSVLEAFVQKAPRIGRAIVRRLLRVTRSNLRIWGGDTVTARAAPCPSPFGRIIQAKKSDHTGLLEEFVTNNEPSLEARHHAAAVQAGIESNFHGLQWASTILLPSSWKVESADLSSALLLASALRAGAVTCPLEGARYPWKETIRTLLDLSHPLAEEYYSDVRRLFANRKRPRVSDLIAPDQGVTLAPADQGVLLQRLIRGNADVLEEICRGELPLKHLCALVQHCPQISKALPYLLQQLFEKRGCTAQEWTAITGEPLSPQQTLFTFSLAASILLEWPISTSPFTWAQPVEAARALVHLLSDSSLQDLQLEPLALMIKRRYGF